MTSRWVCVSGILVARLEPEDLALVGHQDAVRGLAVELRQCWNEWRLGPRRPGHHPRAGCTTRDVGAAATRDADHGLEYRPGDLLRTDDSRHVAALEQIEGGPLQIEPGLIGEVRVLERGADLGLQ